MYMQRKNRAFLARKWPEINASADVETACGDLTLSKAISSLERDRGSKCMGQKDLYRDPAKRELSILTGFLSSEGWIVSQSGLGCSPTAIGRRLGLARNHSRDSWSQSRRVLAKAAPGQENIEHDCEGGGDGAAWRRGERGRRSAGRIGAGAAAGGGFETAGAFCYNLAESSFPVVVTAFGRRSP